VDIKRRRTLDDHLHLGLLAQTKRSPSARASKTNESEERARTATVRNPGEDPHAKLDDGLDSAIVDRRPQTTPQSSPFSPAQNRRHAARN
jgi:hypothetical protein